MISARTTLVDEVSRNSKDSAGTATDMIETEIDDTKSQINMVTKSILFYPSFFCRTFLTKSFKKETFTIY